MPFEDLMMKVGRGEKLNPAELEEWRQSAKGLGSAINAISQWLPIGAATPVFKNPQISDPTFLTTLGSRFLYRTTDTSIANGVDTVIAWEAVYGSTTSFKFDAAAPTKFSFVYPGQSVLLIGGATWTANATGYRNVKLLAYDKANTLLATAVLDTLLGWTGSDNKQTFNFGFTASAYPTASYYLITVGQTSGGALDLLAINIVLFVA